MGGVIKYITKTYFNNFVSMPNNGRDIDIFEYCQYVMRTFEFRKLLNMNLVLPASGCNHGNNHRPFAEWK